MLLPLPDDFGQYDQDWPTYDPEPIDDDPWDTPFAHPEPKEEQDDEAEPGE